MYFVYKGRSSEEFGLKIISINNLSSPQRSVEKRPVPGRNGALIIDNEYFENFQLEIECDVYSGIDNLDAVATRMKEWLQSSLSYEELYLSDGDNYYEAVFINKLDISQMIRNLGSCSLIFDCKPFRKVTGEEFITITSQATITNIYAYNSPPYMKVYGNGDVTIYINNRTLVLKNIEEYIEVDSEVVNCYKMTNGVMDNQNDRMYSPFPYLEPGENNISWTGNITKIEIEPRWVVL